MNSRQQFFEQGERTNDAENASLIHQRNVAYVAVVFVAIIAMLAVGAVIVLVPLKEKEPWIIRENTVTGEFSFPERITEENYKAIDPTTFKFMYEYLKARVRFKPSSLQEDIDKVYLLSSQASADEYQKFLDDDPDSPTKLGRNDSRKFSLRTLIPLEEGLMQARFTTTDTKNGMEQDPKTWIATIYYGYSANNVPTDKENRFFNPVGFMVTDYSRDPEIIQKNR